MYPGSLYLNLGYGESLGTGSGRRACEGIKIDLSVFLIQPTKNVFPYLNERRHIRDRVRRLPIGEERNHIPCKANVFANGSADARLVTAAT